MIAGAIRHVLLVFQESKVRCLLMGGQACVLYGAAEFSKDIDFALLAEEENLVRLKDALGRLDAETIAVPPFERKHLERGLAIHFRCRKPAADGLRIDVMSRLRGLDSFEHLWDRRTTVSLDDDSLQVDVLSLVDLVRAKKTQRDKDWPMIARLVEANYFANQNDPTPEQIDFWLTEMRSPDQLRALVNKYPEAAAGVRLKRPLLEFALSSNQDAPDLETAILAEEQDERKRDREHWAPLKALLSELRAQRRSQS